MPWTMLFSTAELPSPKYYLSVVFENWFTIFTLCWVGLIIRHMIGMGDAVILEPPRLRLEGAWHRMENGKANNRFAFRLK